VLGSERGVSDLPVTSPADGRWSQDAPWPTCLFPTPLADSSSAVRPDCGAFSTGASQSHIERVGAFPGHGFCPSHLPRESARLGALFGGSAQPALSSRFSSSCRPQHAGRCERTSRLAGFRCAFEQVPIPELFTKELAEDQKTSSLNQLYFKDI
jgi:hypothetical protein